MPKTNPDIKSKVGNINHPFSKRENEAALKMYGSHPARQAVVSGNGAVYDALQEFKNAQTNFGANTPASVVNPNQNINPNAASVALPEVKAAIFGSGTYENPTSTTNPNANDNTSSISTYSFLDDAQRVADWKERNPHKNVFGFNKRNAESIQARIDKARAQGKEAKVARLTKKLNNFQDNQARRAAPGDTYTRNESVETGVGKDGKTVTTRSKTKNKEKDVKEFINSTF